MEKGLQQGCILLPCLFNLYAEHIMQNAGLDELQAGINCREKYQQWYADDTTLNGWNQRQTKKILDEGKRGEWKGQLKPQY